MHKKADVNWMVVSMVIAVIALAIVTFIFWKYITQSASQAEGIAKCEPRGGKCRPSACEAGETSLGKYSCDEGEVCCIPEKRSDE